MHVRHWRHGTRIKVRVPRHCVALPRPKPEVSMVIRWPLDEGPLLVHEGRALVGQVEVIRLEGPDGQELPEDLVGGSPACEAHLREEHDVHGRLPVQLEVHKNVVPAAQGPEVRAGLHDAPGTREDRMEPRHEAIFEVLEIRVVAVPEEPEGPVARTTRSLLPLALGLALGDLEDLLRTCAAPLLVWC